MAVPDHIYVRDARDRVIDLLGFGETAPLRDVAVEQDGLMVPLSKPAQIEIQPGQTGVKYLLRHRDGDTLGRPYLANGTGTKTTLTTPKIEADVTYKILARRALSREDPPPREAYLHDVAPIKVGLDATLAARILPVDGEPGEPVPVVDYGAAIRVEVLLSQPGVDYELIVSPDGDVISTASVPGNMATIVIDSIAMHEDVDVRVRATRRLEASDGQEDHVRLLDVVLPLNVRANPTLALAVAEPIIDQRAATNLTIGASQEDADYQVLLRQLSRSDVIFDETAESVIRVSVPDEPDVLVLRPSPAEPVTDYTILGPPVPGTGDDLTFSLDSVAEDTVLIVIAGKDHVGTRSVVQLDQAVVVLVRPNPDQGLSLTVPLTNDRMAGTIEVAGGQPGVFYYFSRGAAGTAAAGAPAYFPHPGDFGGGIGEIRIGVDFVVAGMGDPIIPIGDTSLPSELHVRAVKSLTRVSAQLAKGATISAVPEVRLDKADIVAGTKARMVVIASVEGERYQPFLFGSAIRQARIGNGSDLVFLSDPLSYDAPIVMHANTAPTHPGVAVERRMALDVSVWPAVDARVLAPPLDPASTSATGPRLVDWGEPVEVEIAGSDPRFNYGVVDLSGTSPVLVSKKPVVGNEGRITVPTKALTEDAVLRIRVSKAGELDGSGSRHYFVLAPALQVAVRANAGLVLSADTVVEHAAETAFAIEGSQRSATYTAFTRPVTDGDLFPADRAGTVEVVVDDRSITVLWPLTGGDDGAVPPGGFGIAGAPQSGTGGNLPLPVGALREDVHVVVTATKDHSGRESVVALHQPVVVFVRPDAEPGLELTAGVAEGRLETLLVSGGQPGVYYFFRRGARGVEYPEPAYFHQRDEDGNRGVDRLRLGVDLSVARGAGGVGPAHDPMLVVPLPRKLDATWQVRAVKGLTAIEAVLAETARSWPLPEIVLEAAQVAPGTPARILIRPTVRGERYALYRGGVAEGDAALGDGRDLVLVTEPLGADELFEVGASRPDDPGIPVERRVTMFVEVTAEGVE